MWYLIQTKKRDEIKARNNLDSQGYDTYLPLLNGNVIFPGYLFVSIHQEAFAPINSTRGVIGLVRFGDQLAIVPEKLIEGFRQTEWHLAQDYPAGSVVQITDGPFKYMKAIVKARQADRIVLLLNLMHQEQTITLPLKSVSQGA
jgi:transcriptional antiterminator RfaH